MAKEFCVFGSINMDLVTRVPRFPEPGETITGNGFSTSPGGKGANQAVALARLGGHVRMAGVVGDDMFGDEYLENFRKQGVDFSLVEVHPGGTTGIAAIEVDRHGENHIVVVPGTNNLVDSDYLSRNRAALADADFFLFQFETPLDAVYAAISAFHDQGKTILLDPAPVPESPVPREIYPMVDVITPNEKEIEQLTGIPVENDEGMRRAGEKLLELGVKNVVIKAGARGACTVTADGFTIVPSFSVDVQDTTGAGDTFNAGLAYALSEGRDLNEAVLFAAAAGALACSGIGAQSSMPGVDDVKRVVNSSR